MRKSVFLRPIESLSDTEIDVLVSILNNNNDLQKWLYQDETTIRKFTRDELIKIGQEWAFKKNAKVYWIFTDLPIGEISKSHITNDGHARIGSWITSHEWRKGYGTKAIELALQKARELGIKLALWQKYNPVQSMIEDNRVQLRLKI